MIKRVPWDVISINENIEIDYTSSYGFSRNMEIIIRENINIQFALAQVYPYKNYKEFSSYQCTIDFLSNQSETSQIENLKLCFSTISFFRVNGQTKLCQVSRPNNETLNIFEKLMETNQLNHFLTYFILKPFKNDYFEMGLYEIVTDESPEENNLIIERMKQDPFINYILFSQRNLIEQIGFPISGFSMDEIDKDKYVKCFSKLVEHLYIIISETELNNKTYYTKYLTWNK